MSKLWAIFVPGADEYHAAPSEAAAKHMAERHIAVMQEYVAKNKLDWARGLIEAEVIEWPFDPESHAQELAEFDYDGWGLKDAPAPKRCLSCGRAQEPDGSLPCGH